MAIVHVPSHVRQRHTLVTVMIFASVSRILPWQNGHRVGLVTSTGCCSNTGTTSLVKALTGPLDLPMAFASTATEVPVHRREKRQMLAGRFARGAAVAVVIWEDRCSTSVRRTTVAGMREHVKSPARWNRTLRGG